MKNDAKRTSTGLSLKEAMHLQALEGNPLDAEQVAMFEMFEREGWSEERCIDYLRQRVFDRHGVIAGE
jgi:hypothetical protein